MNASALAASTAADVGFIGLDVFCGVAANSILVGAHHAGPKFVKDLESRLVARQSELPLKLDGRHAGRLAGDQIGCPEPHAERCMGAFHDGSRSEARVTATFPATQYTRASGNVPRLAWCPAVLADESIAPSGTLKVVRAGRFVREQSLELREGARKPQTISLKHVDNHGRPRLA